LIRALLDQLSNFRHCHQGTASYEAWGGEYPGRHAVIGNTPLGKPRTLGLVTSSSHALRSGVDEEHPSHTQCAVKSRSPHGTCYHGHFVICRPADSARTMLIPKMTRLDSQVRKFSGCRGLAHKDQLLNWLRCHPRTLVAPDFLTFFRNLPCQAPLKSVRRPAGSRQIRK
jgi:hypothetical protein